MAGSAIRNSLKLQLLSEAGTCTSTLMFPGVLSPGSSATWTRPSSIGTILRLPAGDDASQRSDVTMPAYRTLGMDAECRGCRLELARERELAVHC